MLQLNVNGQRDDFTVAAILLTWVLRDGLKLTGIMSGCGIAFQVICVVLVEDNPVRSLPVEHNS